LKNNTTEDYDFLISQLNRIIGFLDVSELEVFNKIKDHNKLGFSIKQLYENSYEDYKNHICSSALLLGFAHLEDFLVKRLADYYIENPEKNELKITYRMYLEKKDYIPEYLANEYVRKLSFSEKLNKIKAIYPIDEKLIESIKFISEVRNCLMHNNGIANERINSKYPIGKKIELDTGSVNQYGLIVREFAESIKKSATN